MNLGSLRFQTLFLIFVLDRNQNPRNDLTEQNVLMNPLLWNTSQLPNPAINPAINQFHRIRQQQLQQHSSIYLQQQRLQAQQKQLQQEELIRQKILLNNLLRNNSHSHFVSRNILASL